jgi:hypothetical protein
VIEIFEVHGHNYFNRFDEVEEILSKIEDLYWDLFDRESD